MADPLTPSAEREHVRRTLEQRAHALARPPADEEPAGTIEMVVLAVGGERYGVDAQHVREVLVLTGLAPVPGTPAFWSGLVNVRGTLYPVLDLGRYLSLPDAPAAERRRSVVLISGTRLTIGMAVDGTPETRRVPTASIGPALAGVSQALRTAVRGVTDDLLTVLDVEVLLADPTLVVRKEPA